MFLTGPCNSIRYAVQGFGPFARFGRIVSNCVGNAGPVACWSRRLGPGVFGLVTSRIRPIREVVWGWGRGPLGVVLGPAKGSPLSPRISLLPGQGAKIEVHVPCSMAETGRGAEILGSFFDLFQSGRSDFPLLNLQRGGVPRAFRLGVPRPDALL
jgi:hypothetical protein